MTDEDLIVRLRERGGRIPTAAADRIEALVADFADCNSERQRWKARADAAEAELLAMRLAVQHANDHADAAIKDMEALVKENSDLKRRCINAEAAVLPLVDEREQAEARAKRLKAEVEKLRESIRHLKREWYLRDLQSFDFDAALKQKDRTETTLRHDWRSVSTKTEDGYNG